MSDSCAFEVHYVRQMPAGDAARVRVTSSDTEEQLTLLSGRCRNCEHWKPLYTGEAWGVRSFADAPESERQAILDRIAQFRRRADISDWPMWGECGLTALGERRPSLARAIDGSNYMAVLRCHADFGCVQFARFNEPGDAAHE